MHIVQFMLGTQFGQCGHEEHGAIKLSKISFSFYSLTAHSDLAGKQYVQINGECISKYL